MRIREFAADRLGEILLSLVSMVVLAAFLLATGTASGVVLIIVIVWALGFTAIQGARYVRVNTRLRELEAVMDGLDRKYLFAECAPRTKDAYERRLFTLMRRSGKAMIEAVSGAENAQREYREYIESWVHEIKAPITAARLISENADPDTRRKILPQLDQIDSHVERALFYARSESAEKDFVIRQAVLSDIVTQAIGRHRALLLQSGVRIETENLDEAVYTDDKWVVFILGQLLQNAVRYRSESPVITISARSLGRQVQLTVQDNGIGIPAHELSRIFDRGFTGSNGRTRGGATGMGLYICRRLAAFLEIDLAARSGEGEGTGIIITFPARENLSKV